MSDDEEYYDEYYEEIWIEEPEPGIADDLAKTAHHDPVFIDDPSYYEVADYCSDWDELTDDYFDDEPTILKRQRLMGLEGAGDTPGDPGEVNDNTNTQINQKQKQKQKPSNFLDPSSFQSVIWKPADYDAKNKPGKLHPAGEGEKVALLKNWREIFKQSNPALDRPSRLKKMITSSSPSGSSDHPVSGVAARSVAAEDLDKNKREDSSDRTSGISSLDNLRDNEGAESVTTPGKSSPGSVGVNGVGRDEEMGDAVAVNEKGGEAEGQVPKKSRNTIIEIPVLESMPQPAESPPAKTPPKKRGRKRKADLIAEAEAEAAGKEKEDVKENKRPRSKRIASGTGGEGDKKLNSTGGPVRRSTRQKNN
ncbi:hypothetical protein PHISCL_08782 [Aspergillus sclerotialis]|uniref:Uncharacterized protein n=1 Tax=Aspergillus sclerotialis TaxID=2070753 RepID=A0A3A2ZP66_9EURO|nr:hypothetical protein PHISCL_08782 [Aspergillus sclerotialis]